MKFYQSYCTTTPLVNSTKRVMGGGGQIKGNNSYCDGKGNLAYTMLTNGT